MRTSITFDDISPAFMSTSTSLKIAHLLDGIGVPSTFFVVPYESRQTAISQEFASCLKQIRTLGHEISLHGYRHTRNEFGYFYPIPLPRIRIPTLEKQREAILKAVRNLQRLSGERPHGFRSPFYLYNKSTLEALSALGFRYDSSVTVFKPTHGRRLRLRWSTECGPYLDHGLTEIPVTGDYTYNLDSSNFVFSLKRALHDFELVKSCNGAFVVNFHANRMSTDLLSEFLKNLIEKLHNKTEFVRLIDMCPT